MLELHEKAAESYQAQIQHGQIPEVVQVQASSLQVKCSMCGQTALYRVHSLGFCKDHAQAARIIPSDYKPHKPHKICLRMSAKARKDNSHV